MGRTWIGVLSMLGIGLSGCTGDVLQASSQTAAAGSGAGGAGTASSSTASSGTGGAGGAGPSGALSGHYMQHTIGNCADFESWFSFDTPPAFTHTDIDRNFCGPHSVTPEPGTYKLSGANLEMTWTSPKGSELRQFTHVRIDPFPEGPIVPFPKGYMPGTAAINAMAYARAGGALTWHRDD